MLWRETCSLKRAAQGGCCTCQAASRMHDMIRCSAVTAAHLQLAQGVGPPLCGAPVEQLGAKVEAVCGGGGGDTTWVAVAGASPPVKPLHWPRQEAQSPALHLQTLHCMHTAHTWRSPQLDRIKGRLKHDRRGRRVDSRRKCTLLRRGREQRNRLAAAAAAAALLTIMRLQGERAQRNVT